MRGQIWPPNHREAASAPGYNTTGLLPPLSRSHTPLAQVERPPSGGAATHPRRSGSAPVSLEALLHGEAGALHARSGAEVERRSSRPLYHTPGGEVRKWKGRRPTETPVRCKPYSGHLILQTPTPTPTPTLIHSVHISTACIKREQNGRQPADLPPHMAHLATSENFLDVLET